jgi:predicted naringenin-chalcone synthase
MAQDRLWKDFFASHFKAARWAERVYWSAGVNQRHPAVDPTVDDISDWTTAARMGRYLTEATPLAAGAAAKALAGAGLDAAEVGLLAVVSCTGYATPGLDVAVARHLGLAPATERALFGHMGCHAALPALALVSDYVAHRGRPALLLCVELSSLHLQPASQDLSQVLAHALFSDAAAAIVVQPDADGMRSQPPLQVIGSGSFTDTAAAAHITWEVTDTGFRMGLSRQVPNLVAEHVGATVHSLLGRFGLARGDVDAWAVHPGGAGVLDAVARALELPDDALDASRHVLAQCGNCSSGTVLLVLEELQRRGQLRPGRPVVLLAFGPGLTVYAVLLEVAGTLGRSGRPS